MPKSSKNAGLWGTDFGAVFGTVGEDDLVDGWGGRFGSQLGPGSVALASREPLSNRLWTTLIGTLSKKSETKIFVI